jgi:hypothetical protein
MNEGKTPKQSKRKYKDYEKEQQTPGEGNGYLDCEAEHRLPL